MYDGRGGGGGGEGEGAHKGVREARTLLGIMRVGVCSSRALSSYTGVGGGSRDREGGVAADAPPPPTLRCGCVSKPSPDVQGGGSRDGSSHDNGGDGGGDGACRGKHKGKPRGKDRGKHRGEPRGKHRG